jgi:hypothetical protein
MNISSVSTVLLFVYSIIENGTRRLPWTPKASIYFSLQKLSGVTCDIIQSGLVSFLNSSPPCTEAVVSLDGKLLSNKCSPPLSRCANLCVYVVCLECGHRGKTLRRHVSTRHGLNRGEYLQRWGLQNDHPLTAPAYSEHRSTLAKQLGLGREPRADEAPASTPAESAVANGDEKVEAADGDIESSAKPRRTTRSGSRSDAVNEAASEPTKPRQMRPRSPVAPPQSEPLPTPTADA